jgi:NhaA family Na+:H+ antiporter
MGFPLLLFTVTLLPPGLFLCQPVGVTNQDHGNGVVERIEKKVESIISSFQQLIRDETVSSGFLFAATLLALLLANSAAASQYLAAVTLPIKLMLGDWLFEFDVLHFVNDGLMTLFFMVLGLEIKRELLVGELRNMRQAVPVLAAALGGMVLPALIYYLINAGEPSARGWGIAMATDSAFALGVLMLLGRRVPAGLKAFLVAYAIIDDLGAILVIAFFYTEALDTAFLVAAAGCFSVLAVFNFLGLRHLFLYLCVGFLLWFCLVSAGVHGTVAGVLIAAAVPARPRRDQRWFVRRTQKLAGMLQQRIERGDSILEAPEQHAMAEAVSEAAKSVTTPLQRWERMLERPVLLFVLPLFALVNAGIPLSGERLTTAASDVVSWGVVFGLVAGKTLGISLMTWITLMAGIGRLPEGVRMGHVIGVALLGGMGFTMSIFIAGLTFSGQEPLYIAKIAILAASIVAGGSGYLWLRFAVKPENSYK